MSTHRMTVEDSFIPTLVELAQPRRTTDMGYDNWKCTDPAEEAGYWWEKAEDLYVNSDQYVRDMEEWVHEARAEDPSRNWTEDDYLESAEFENTVESLMRGD